MIRSRLWTPTGRLILLGIGLLGLLGCNLLSSAPSDSKDPSASPKLKTLATQPLSPSTSEQTAIYADQVKVIFPGGVVTSAQDIVISSVTGLPDPSIFRKVLRMYDFSMTNQDTFEQPVQIELAYDPQDLDPGKPAASQLTAAYWDETMRTWVPEAFSVDESRHVILITTNHLSIRGYLSWVAGYQNFTSEHFSIVYDEKAIKNGSAIYYKAVSSPKRVGMLDFPSDILNFLEEEYKAYTAAGYPLPAGTINVEVNNAAYSELVGLTGVIRITTLSWVDSNLLRHDTAHELFHAVEYQALGWNYNRARRWWLEAAADYAADKVAWKGTINVMGQDIRPKYLESPITDTNDFHDYSTSHFIDYLVKNQSIYEFSDLWWQTATGGDNVLNTLVGLVQDPKSLGQQYGDFARYFVFDPASPDKKTTSISTSIAYKTSEMNQSDTELEESFDVGYFTAKLWAVKSMYERDVLIERLDDSAGTVAYAILSGDTRNSPVSVSPTDMFADKTVTLHIKAGETLYLLVDNHISTSSQTVQLKITETTIPSGMFSMTIKYDDGCDAAYKNDYNSYSRVNTNIPVKIDGEKVTISYDKTTGMKHLVAEGSGKIDKTGTMTLNFTLTYTVEQSCDGTPCMGTETVTGTFKGTAQSGGLWEGKATGTVTSDYPNTLGKLGDNSIDCTASPLQARLRPGFTDTDL